MAHSSERPLRRVAWKTCYRGCTSILPAQRQRIHHVQIRTMLSICRQESFVARIVCRETLLVVWLPPVTALCRFPGSFARRRPQPEMARVLGDDDHEVLGHCAAACGRVHGAAGSAGFWPSDVVVVDNSCFAAAALIVTELVAPGLGHSQPARRGHSNRYTDPPATQPWPRARHRPDA